MGSHEPRPLAHSPWHLPAPAALVIHTAPGSQWAPANPGFRGTPVNPGLGQAKCQADYQGPRLWTPQHQAGSPWAQIPSPPGASPATRDYRPAPIDPGSWLALHQACPSLKANSHEPRLLGSPTARSALKDSNLGWPLRPQVTG